jgi:hypothetical protein
MASIVVPLEVAQMRLMLAMEFLRGIKDLQPRGFPLHACFALLNLFGERKEPWLGAFRYASVVIDLHISVEQKQETGPGPVSLMVVSYVQIAQALEALVVSAADMAVARRTHPATARKPMVRGRIAHPSFPPLASAFVAVVTES